MNLLLQLTHKNTKIVCVSLFNLKFMLALFISRSVCPKLIQLHVNRQIILRENMFLILERSFLALDWEPELKKRYFDDSAAEVSCSCCSPFQH